MIKVYTFANKRPDFVPLQLESFGRHLHEDYEFTVFNNAVFGPDRCNYDLIKSYGAIDVELDAEMVAKYKDYETVRLFGYDGSYGNPNIACAYSLCWAWKHVISKQRCAVLFLDSDIFLFEPVRLSDIADRYDLCFVPQSLNGAPQHMHSGLVLANLARIPEPESIDWWCGKVRGFPVDVGGQTSLYLESHPELSKLFITEHNVEDDPLLPFHPSDYQILRIEQQQFLHYRRGSNWINRSTEYNRMKTEWLRHELHIL